MPADTQPCVWIVEYGAISLPFGHPSRLTCFELHDTEPAAQAAADGMGFDARVFPALIPTPADNYRAQEVDHAR